MYKIRSRSVFLNIDVPVSLPGIEAKMVYQLFINLGQNKKASYDMDLVDIEDVYFMGLKVTDPRKFFDNQKSIGIDIEEILYQQAEAILNKEECQIIANDYLDLIL